MGVLRNNGKIRDIPKDMNSMNYSEHLVTFLD